jgi:hypothetical protein
MSDPRVLSAPGSKVVIGFRSASGADWFDSEDGRPYRVLLTEAGLALAHFQDRPDSYELLWEGFPQTDAEKTNTLFRTIIGFKEAVHAGAAEAYNPDNDEAYPRDDMPTLGWAKGTLTAVPHAERARLVGQLAAQAAAAGEQFVNGTDVELA